MRMRASGMYASMLKPVGGRMGYAGWPGPVCGVDGTAAADAAIAQSMPVEAELATTPTATISRFASVASAPEAQELGNPVSAAGRPTPSLMPGQVDRTTAEREARAKIFWGDSTDEVLRFLMRNGFTAVEASAQVNEMFQERASVIRKNGVFKITYGSILACVPVASWFFFVHIGIIPMKIFALLIMVGLYGAYQAVKGTIMVISRECGAGRRSVRIDAFSHCVAGWWWLLLADAADFLCSRFFAGFLCPFCVRRDRGTDYQRSTAVS